MKSAPPVLGMFIVGLGLASTIVLTAERSTQQSDAPTRIQVGVLTESQRVHSKLYKDYSAGRRLDIRLPESGPQKKGEQATLEESVYLELGTPVTSPNAAVVSFDDFLRKLSCDADAVVIGLVKDRTSQLTDGNEFIFSDYVVTAEEIFRTGSAGYLAPNSDITVTRPGGKIEIRGRIVNAVDASFKPIEKGQRYLLFLKHVPETGAYQSMRNGTFLLQDGALVAMTEEFIPGSTDDTKPLNAETRRVLSIGCGTNK